MNATMTKTIMDNGEQIDVTREQLVKVRKLVYWCPDCKAYHLWDGNDFEDIEVIIGK
jgi:hypothetical protein